MLSDDIVRKFSRIEYKAAMRWLRIVRREILKRINPEEVDKAVQNAMLLGIYGNGKA